MIDIDDVSIEELELALRQKKKQELEETDLISNEELINKFLDSLNSKTTKKTYKYAINHFLKFIANKNLQLVTKLDLERYFTYLNNSGYKKQTKQLKYGVMVSFYKYFMHLQEIDSTNSLNLHFIENPTTDTNRNWKPDTEINETDILTNEEIRLILEELKKVNYRDYIIFYILADTSMRINGLCNIEIKNMDFERRTIKTFDKGKMRKYAFGDNLKKELLKYLKIREKIKSIHYNEKYLFFSRKNEQLSTGTVKSHIFPKISEMVLELVGKNITAHSLRRSFKTNRTNHGQLREQIEALMNHKNGLDNSYNRPTHEMFLKWFDDYET